MIDALNQNFNPVIVELQQLFQTYFLSKTLNWTLRYQIMQEICQEIVPKTDQSRLDVLEHFSRNICTKADFRLQTDVTTFQKRPLFGNI